MVVQETWSRLLLVRKLTFEARSGAVPGTGWSGSGRGTVQVAANETGVLAFHEKGEWSQDGGRPTTFSNVFRWTADVDGRCIRLEHLRFGPERPVYLFDLIPEGNRILVSSAPHSCREDLYTARLELNEQEIRLTWTVEGPNEAERIAYLYR